jgi:hypothetical protein
VQVTHLLAAITALAPETLGMTTLDLSGKHMGFKAAPVLAVAIGASGSCPAVERLLLSNNYLSNACVEPLLEALRKPETLPCLTELDLDHNDGFHGAQPALIAALEASGASARMQILKLSYTGFGTLERCAA